MALNAAGSTDPNQADNFEEIEKQFAVKGMLLSPSALQMKEANALQLSSI